MPENVNTTPLQNLEDPSFDEHSTAENMIKVDHVSMIFNMASEQLNSLKEYAIALARHELRFKEFRALNDVSFEVRKGDVFGILGTNGSGKSTLLKIIAGVLDPSEGSIEINGSIAPLIELGAGFDLELTARENIYLNGALLGYSKKFIDESFDEIVEFAEVKEFLDMPMKNYSSGMVARIAFAIATVIIPDILIVDEVLSVGDFMFQQKCERRITKLIKEHEVTVLIVSHSNDQIERLCNKAIWIEKGHTRMMGDARDVCRIYRVLGGHIGSEKSERQVFDMLNAKTPIPEGVLKTIAGEDRYGTAANLMEKAGYEPGGVALIVPGEHASPCLMATGLSGILDAPILPTKAEVLPDTISQWLKRYAPSRIVILGSTALVSQKVEDSLAVLFKHSQIERIEGESWDELSANVYEFGKGQGSGWGKTALLTYDGCSGDLVSFSPLSWTKRMPTFFIKENGRATEPVEKIIASNNLNHILALGGDCHFSDEYLNDLVDKTTWKRIAGRDCYHANRMINEIVEETFFDESSPTALEYIVCTTWDPADAFSIGAYAGKKNSLTILEDPQNLDSVAQAIEYIGLKQNDIRQLTFLGDHTRFSDLDKSLLGKALSQTEDSPSNTDN
ncbi:MULTISPECIES: ATP-binding cassette domain-containing protein [unclassified Adlercreutzia]|uniref:ATP-binding cassette domain-containing protein n=1 Tax=unclassified Adlercreutzia TaxID=2636013 RepID=UPI0013EACA2F|nr:MULTISPECIES: ATP-binding cassette domain-containing protein [unclassified Adlercreutzia]